MPHGLAFPIRIFIVTMMGLLATGTVAFGQPDGGAVVQTRTDAAIGEYLVDAAGRTIYVFSEDAPFVSTCIDDCAETWLPVTFEGMAPSSDGVNPVLIGSTVRPDGTAQATFASMPLYTFIGDDAEGSMKGLEEGGSWMALAPDGTILGADPATEDAGDATVLSGEELFSAGREIYQVYCVGCHEADGRGSVGPDLRANTRLADPVAVARQIRDGMSEMPGFGAVLSNHDLAAVATFVRGSWGNDYPAMTPDQFDR